MTKCIWLDEAYGASLWEQAKNSGRYTSSIKTLDILHWIGLDRIKWSGAINSDSNNLPCCHWRPNMWPKVRRRVLIDWQMLWNDRRQMWGNRTKGAWRKPNAAEARNWHPDQRRLLNNDKVVIDECSLLSQNDAIVSMRIVIKELMIGDLDGLHV